MDMHLTDHSEEPMAETPEDVAILYSWANLHGAKYRDFSASRREYRAQVRHRAAEQLRQHELSAQAAAEEAAAESERKAREAERSVRNFERFESPLDRERALRDADEAARRASSERVEAARRAEAAANAEAAARREEREIAEAHASAARQAARWNDSEIRRRTQAGPQPVGVPSRGGDPYEGAQGSTVDGSLYSPNEGLEYTQPQRYRGEALRMEPNRTDFEQVEEHRGPFQQQESFDRNLRGFRPDQPSGVRAAYRAPAGEAGSIRNRNNAGSYAARPNTPQPVFPSQPRHVTPAPQVPAGPASKQEFYPNLPEAMPAVPGSDRIWQTQEPSAPAWLYGNNPPAQPSAPRPLVHAGMPAAGADTLQSSRERVASRWYALKGVFEDVPDTETEVHPGEARTPVLSIFSFAGGVGKTSMVATLGRALSSLGEKVLLADTTSHGLLPYYFGATELKPGVVRTFSPPAGSTDAPIHLVSYDVDRLGEASAREALANEITRSAGGVQRLVVDFNAVSGWLMRRFTRMAETVLVPLAPDMNSVISLQTLERYFEGASDADGRPLKPFYVLNQFDASLPLHLDVREVLRRQLGDRLLPFVVRRSPAVSEALAEGMTVVDYQPEGSISEDYLTIAKWLRGISFPASLGVRTNRWSER